jgi:hypothetical protein
VEDRWSNDELNHIVDNVYKKVAALFLAMDDSFYSISDTFDLETNTELYDLPSDFIRIKSVLDENNEPVTRLYNIAKKRDYVSGSGGIPRKYYFLGNQMGFLDVPNANFTYPYVYIHAPDPLIDDDSVPDVPEYLGHELIAHETAQKALSLDEEINPTLENEIKDLRRQIIEVYHRRNTDFSPQVEDDPALDEL